MASAEYKRGFRDGVLKRNRKKELSVVKSDLIYIYGGMCVAMARRGYKQETIINFIKQIHELWQQCVEQGISMRDLCIQEAAIDIEQIVEGE